MLILRAFTHQKKLRFSEICEALPEINSRILSERLGELEAEGMITREVEDTKPVSSSYVITPKGMDLQKVFDGFVAWGKKWGKENDKCQEC